MISSYLVPELRQSAVRAAPLVVLLTWLDWSTRDKDETRMALVAMVLAAATLSTQVYSQRTLSNFFAMLGDSRTRLHDAQLRVAKHSTSIQVEVQRIAASAEQELVEYTVQVRLESQIVLEAPYITMLLSLGYVALPTWWHLAPGCLLLWFACYLFQVAATFQTVIEEISSDINGILADIDTLI